MSSSSAAAGTGWRRRTTWPQSTASAMSPFWNRATSAAAGRGGIETHQKTRVTGIEVRDGAVAGVHTDRGFIKSRKVLSAVAGWTTHVTQMVGLRSPLLIYPLQAFVTEPLKPWLDHIIVSASLHMYVSQ